MNVDLTVTVPALEMLVKYTASGIGAVAGPLLAPWRAKREAQARLISAQAEADSVRIIADAQAIAHRTFADSDNVQGVLDIGPDGIAQRIEYQEQKRQANLASVVREAARELGDREVAPHEPDHDWSARFFGSVQDVSSEDMRRIWAHILAGEVEQPGSTSLRTIATLRNLTAGEAKAFSGIARFRIGRVVYPDPNTLYDGHTMALMEEVGLIRSTQEGIVDISVVNGPEIIHRGSRYVLVVEAEPSTHMAMRAHELTGPGREIAQCIEQDPDMRFLGRIAHTLQERGFTLRIATDLPKSADGQLDCDADQLRVVRPIPP